METFFAVFHVILAVTGIPAGRFSMIHTVYVTGKDGEAVVQVRQNLERLTCFKLAASPLGADATLTIALIGRPPADARAVYKAGDAELWYQGSLVGRNGHKLWSASTTHSGVYGSPPPMPSPVSLLTRLQAAGCSTAKK